MEMEILSLVSWYFLIILIESLGLFKSTLHRNKLSAHMCQFQTHRRFHLEKKKKLLKDIPQDRNSYSACM